MQCYDADKVCESPVEPSGKNHEIEPERSRATAQAHLSGPSPQTLAGSSRKRGRPLVEPSPRQKAENEAAEAKSTYVEAKGKLHEHVNELRVAGAWFDAPSVVARLDERLDNKCRKVVDLQLKSERADLAVDLARERELADALEGRMAAEERLEEAKLEHLCELQAKDREIQRMYGECLRMNQELQVKNQELLERNQEDIERCKKVVRECHMRELWEEGIL